MSDAAPKTLGEGSQEIIGQNSKSDEKTTKGLIHERGERIEGKVSIPAKKSPAEKIPPPSSEAQLTAAKAVDELDLANADPQTIADALIQAETLSVNGLDLKLAVLRAIRTEGSSSIRKSSFMPDPEASTLDSVLVSLVEVGHFDLAKSLLSPSRRDGRDDSFLMDQVSLQIKDPIQAEKIKDKIIELHSEKLTEYNETLTSRGGDERIIQILLKSAVDPEQALNCGADFWHIISSDYNLKQRVEGAVGKGVNILHLSSIVMALHKNEIVDTGHAITISMEKINYEEQETYVNSLEKVIKAVSSDEQLKNSDIHIGRIIDHFSRFKNPSKAFEEAKVLFGNSFGKNIQAYEELKIQSGTPGHDLIKSAQDYLQGILQARNSIVLNLLRTNSGTWQEFSKQIANGLLKPGWERDGLTNIATNINAFTELDTDLAFRLVDEGFVATAVENIDKFKGIDRDAFVEYLTSRGYLTDLALNLDAFPNVDHQALAEELIRMGYSDQFYEHFEKFKPVKITPELFKEGLNNEDCDFKSTYELYRKISTDKMPVLDRTARIFGDFATTELYHLLDQLNSGAAAPELSQLGISKVGQEGLDQLEQRMIKLKSDLLSHPEDHADLILNNPLVQSLFKRIIRFEESQWGHKSQSVFENMIRRNQQLTPDESALSEGIESSKTITIATTDGKRQDEERPTFEEDAVTRYQRLRDQLQSARELLQQPQGISRGIEQLRVLVDQGITGKEKAIESLKAKNPTKASELEAEVAKLRGVNLRSIKDFEDNFMLLQGDKRLHDQLSTVMFAWALRHPATRQGPGAYEDRLNAIANLNETPSLDDMSTVIDYVEHIINQETFQTYFKTDVGKKAFSNMTSVESLQKALAKSQSGQEMSGTVPIRLEPTRGLLMEFSGSIADACWADTYESIAQEFPNFTAVTIRQHPEGSSDSLVGAFMMIEAEATDGGEPLLIIRGLNPRENFINRTDVANFFTEISNYVTEQARRLGRRAAIVIDNHSGGSSTNRPVLFEHLNSLKPGLSPIVPKGKTEFNGYRIDNNTYLI